MARLIVYVPFTRGAVAAGDLRTNAAELAGAPLAGFAIRGTPITAIVTVFLGEEALPGNQVAAGDIFLLHAHGGPDDFTDLVDNRGEQIDLDTLLANMATLTVANAAAAYFFACFSAQPDHIADVWRGMVPPAQLVFGSGEVVEGGIIRTTRTAIRSSIFDLTNRQLTEL